mgnify:CR=1 FL=1
MGVFYVLDSKFDVVFNRQETGRWFVLNIGFPRIYSRGVLDLLGIETDEGGDYILYMDTYECCTIYNRIKLF